MRLIGRSILVILIVSIGAFLHYTLPQKDIVYITGTEIIRADFSKWNRMFYASADSGNSGQAVNRDLRLINTTKANGKVMVYRNEDTGLWGWPPYFKISSSDLQAEAERDASSKAEPSWFLVTHYGWRNQWLTTYPNAISFRAIESPEVGKPLPWLNIVILVTLFAVFWAIWVRWRRFRAARIDPTLERWEDNIDAAGDAMADRRKRFRRWWNAR